MLSRTTTWTAAARAVILLGLVVNLAAVAAFARVAKAQTPQLGAADVIRGRVTSDSGKVLAATIVVTRGPDRLTQTTTTDSTGNYSTRFDQGTGDYLVYASATGYRSARRRVQRQGSEHELVANFVLAIDVTLLASTKVQADKPVRANNNVGPMQPETGASEKWIDGVNGQLPPTLAGDFASMLSTLPNITMTPGGPSLLGSGPTSMLTTLNGMATGAVSVPRAAKTETRFTGATYDVTRGGFTGGNLDVRLAAGNRNYQERSAYFTLSPRSLQFTDPTSRTLGATNGGFNGSLGANGELIRDALTYNVSVDVARNTSDPVTLIDAGDDALLRVGASPDSIARVVSLANPAGLPLSSAGIPSARLHNAFTFLSRFDDTRDSLDHRMLTTYFNSTSDGAQGFSALAAPSTSSEHRQQNFGAQYVQDNYVGPGRRILTETRLAGTTIRTHNDPYRETPAASILVRSADTSGGNDISSVLLGGGGSTPSDNSSWIAEGANETDWNVGGRRHRYKTLIWGRADGLRQETSANALGTFGFNSIADFAANHPSSFSRTLTQPIHQGSTWNSAMAFSQEYDPSVFAGLIAGVRVEADGFFGAPAANPSLQQALGVRSDVAPARISLSPRIGFTYRYNRDRGNGNSYMMNQMGRFYRSATGTISGGIGEFRDLLQPSVLADAVAGTGLPGATSYLSCVGSAVPTPDWSQFDSNTASVPTTCANGSGVLGETAPGVTVISPKYEVPHSWMASLNWNSSFDRWLVQVRSLAKYDLSQPGTFDENFSGAPKFSLRDEGNRPVFVSTAAIDPASGSVSPSEARVSDQFGSVNERVSDLRGYGGQLNFNVNYNLSGFSSVIQANTSLGYTLQDSRREYRGFDGAAFGDPRTVEWAPSNGDARHVFVLTAGMASQYTGVITLLARVQSGLPFTPIVQGDVNGDGRIGDRAFIPNPAQATDPVLASELRTLLTSGSGTARECVMAYLGEVAARNGCRGPWTESLNLQWRPPLPNRLRGRVTPVVYLQNVLAGADELLHGPNGMHGWGSTAMPDPTLLVPRGFDPTTQSFRYDVNERFADTRPGRTLIVDPFRLIFDFSLDLTTNPDLQQLRRAVEPVHGLAGWVRRGPDSLATFYLRQTSSIHKFILEQSDSLFLSAPQTLALRRADSVYSRSVISLYMPLAEYLAQGNGDAGKAELDSVTATQKLYWKVFWSQADVIDTILTASQRELLPLVSSLVAMPKANREFSRFVFGHPVTLPRTPAPTIKATDSAADRPSKPPFN
ncbi:MAG TPA: carboxypeptidase-like regulatory domain-containing protein [Gemmatimonadaceae bacterium]|jgi:hypothetical protein|nr:carboxypeptidase-like regulatory domain-containing protein [Gemmatimonadaceae bacterium]